MHVYLAHAVGEAHHEAVAQFRNAVRAFGHIVRIDDDNDAQAVQRALGACRLVLGLVTSDKHDSVRRAIEAAVAARKPVLLLVHESVRLPQLPEKVERVRIGSGSDADTAGAIARVCRGSKHLRADDTAAPLLEALVDVLLALLVMSQVQQEVRLTPDERQRLRADEPIRYGWGHYALNAMPRPRSVPVMAMLAELRLQREAEARIRRRLTRKRKASA